MSISFNIFYTEPTLGRQGPARRTHRSNVFGLGSALLIEKLHNIDIISNLLPDEHCISGYLATSIMCQINSGYIFQKIFN